MKSEAVNVGLTGPACHALHAVVRLIVPILGKLVLKRWAKCQRLAGLLGKELWSG